MWTLGYGHARTGSCGCAFTASPPKLLQVPAGLHRNTFTHHREIFHCESLCCEDGNKGRGASRRTPRPPRSATTFATGATSAIRPEAGEEVLDLRSARLKAWVLEHSQSLPTKLTPVRRIDGSYSLVTDEPVQRGQILIRVPRRLLLSSETARASEVCGPIVRGADLTEWQSLLLHILCERALGPRSFWWPYMDTLPQDMSFHPLLWAPDRLSWLAGSPLEAVLRQRQAQVVEDTELLIVAGANDLPLAEELQASTGSELVSPASVGWAASVLLSRAFSLDLAEEEPLEGDMGYFGTWTGHAADVLALVPWADCLTHCSAAGPESCARYQYELGVVTLSAHRTYRVGEAVKDSHGTHLSPVDLFLDYGMEEPEEVGQGLEQHRHPAEPAAANVEGGALTGEEGSDEWQRHRFDVDPAEVASPRSSRNAALLAALSAVQGGPEDCRLALGCRGPDPASLTFLRAAVASDVELVKAGWRVKATEKDVELACRAMGCLAQPSSTATEGVVLGALAAFVERQLGSYPTSLEQDVARLEGREGEERVTGPERLAVVALASQKRALRGTAQALAAWRAKLMAGCPVQELYEEEYDEEEYFEGGEA